MYNIESAFRQTKYAKQIPRESLDKKETLNPDILGPAKASFENALSLFLMGLATERGLMPNLEPHRFESELVSACLALRKKGYVIESNNSKDLEKRLSRVTTQATQVFLSENIICNKASLQDNQTTPRGIPLIDSPRIRR